jgi:hypothetical protein
MQGTSVLFCSVPFSSVQAFLALRKRNCFCSVLYRHSEPAERETASVLFSPVLLFRHSAQVEMQAASVLFYSVQVFCRSGNARYFCSVLFPSLLFRLSEPFERETASVLFCSVQAF